MCTTAVSCSNRASQTSDDDVVRTIWSGSWTSIRGDITKLSGFIVLQAVFREKHGAFIGLYARTRDMIYRREPGFGWIPVPNHTPELSRSARVSVNYRFIMTFEILGTRDQRPDWDLAGRMRTFSE